MTRKRLNLISVACGVIVAVTIAGCGGSDAGSDAAPTDTDSTAVSSAAATSSSADTGVTAQAPAEPPANQADGLKIAFANFTDAAPLLRQVREGFEAAAEKAGVDLIVYDNQADSEVTLRNAQLMVEEDPDVIVEFNGIDGVAQAVEKVFTDAGIPCISFNSPGAGGCPWLNLYNQSLCGDSGKVVGQVAAERGWTGEDTSVILINAAAFGEAVNSCMGLFYYELQALVPGLAPIDAPTDVKITTTTIGETTYQVDGQGLREPAFENVRDLLQSIPESNNIILYAAGGESTLGGWRALEQAGRSEQALTAGVAGSDEDIEQLRTNPNWVAEGDIFFEFWGQYAIAMAAAMMNDVEPPLLTLAPQAVITKDITIPGTSVVPIDTFYEPDSSEPFQLPPLIPVQEGETVVGPGTVGNDYLEKTGVLQVFGNVQGLTGEAG